MDLPAGSAGPWLVLGIVVGVLLAGLVVLALLGLRKQAPAPEPDHGPTPDATPVAGWREDDLPGFLEQPPGTAAPEAAAEVAAAAAGADVRLTTGPELVDTPARPARLHAGRTAAPVTSSDGTAGRVLLGLAVAAVLLVGAAAVLAALTTPPRGAAAAAGPEPASPSWTAPDVAAVPAAPSPGDPGAGRLSASSVPVGPDGLLARATFGGLVLERRAVGVTVTYPAVSVTSSDATSGPALAHVRLPVWNCLRDDAPTDPVAAGCRRLPTQYAELGTPALAVTSDGEGLRISGDFPTYLRPAGSPPVWTGQVYPLTVTWTPEGGTVHLGTERAPAIDDPQVTGLELGR